MALPLSRWPSWSSYDGSGGSTTLLIIAAVVGGVVFATSLPAFIIYRHYHPINGRFPWQVVSYDVMVILAYTMVCILLAIDNDKVPCVAWQWPPLLLAPMSLSVLFWRGFTLLYHLQLSTRLLTLSGHKNKTNFGPPQLVSALSSISDDDDTYVDRGRHGWLERQRSASNVAGGLASPVERKYEMKKRLERERAFASLAWKYHWSTRNQHVIEAQLATRLIRGAIILYIILIAASSPLVKSWDGPCSLSDNETFAMMCTTATLVLCAILTIAILLLANRMRLHEDAFGLKNEYYRLTACISVATCTIFAYPFVNNDTARTLIIILMALALLTFCMITLWPLYLVCRHHRLSRIIHTNRMTDLGEFIRTETGYDAFLAFCTAEFTSGRLLFYHRVDKFKRMEALTPPFRRRRHGDAAAVKGDGTVATAPLQPQTATNVVDCLAEATNIYHTFCVEHSPFKLGLSAAVITRIANKLVDLQQTLHKLLGHVAMEELQLPPMGSPFVNHGSLDQLLTQSADVPTNAPHHTLQDGFTSINDASRHHDRGAVEPPMMSLSDDGGKDDGNNNSSGNNTSVGDGVPPTILLQPPSPQGSHNNPVYGAPPMSIVPLTLDPTAEAQPSTPSASTGSGFSGGLSPNSPMPASTGTTSPFGRTPTATPSRRRSSAPWLSPNMTHVHAPNAPPPVSITSTITIPPPSNLSLPLSAMSSSSILSSSSSSLSSSITSQSHGIISMSTAITPSLLVGTALASSISSSNIAALATSHISPSSSASLSSSSSSTSDDATPLTLLSLAPLSIGALPSSSSATSASSASSEVTTLSSSSSSTMITSASPAATSSASSQFAGLATSTQPSSLSSPSSSLASSTSPTQHTVTISNNIIMIPTPRSSSSGSLSLSPRPGTLPPLSQSSSTSLPSSPLPPSSLSVSIGIFGQPSSGATTAAGMAAAVLPLVRTPSPAIRGHHHLHMHHPPPHHHHHRHEGSGSGGSGGSSGGGGSSSGGSIAHSSHIPHSSPQMISSPSPSPPLSLRSTAAGMDSVSGGASSFAGGITDGGLSGSLAGGLRSPLPPIPFPSPLLRGLSGLPPPASSPTSAHGSGSGGGSGGAPGSGPTSPSGRGPTSGSHHHFALASHGRRVSNTSRGNQSTRSLMTPPPAPTLAPQASPAVLITMGGTAASSPISGARLTAPLISPLHSPMRSSASPSPRDDGASANSGAMTGTISSATIANGGNGNGLAGVAQILASPTIGSPSGAMPEDFLAEQIRGIFDEAANFVYQEMQSTSWVRFRSSRRWGILHQNATRGWTDQQRRRGDTPPNHSAAIAVIGHGTTTNGHGHSNGGGTALNQLASPTLGVDHTRDITTVALSPTPAAITSPLSVPREITSTNSHSGHHGSGRRTIANTTSVSTAAATAHGPVLSPRSMARPVPLHQTLTTPLSPSMAARTVTTHRDINNNATNNLASGGYGTMSRSMSHERDISPRRGHHGHSHGHTGTSARDSRVLRASQSQRAGTYQIPSSPLTATSHGIATTMTTTTATPVPTPMVAAVASTNTTNNAMILSPSFSSSSLTGGVISGATGGGHHGYGGVARTATHSLPPTSSSLTFTSSNGPL